MADQYANIDDLRVCKNCGHVLIPKNQDRTEYLHIILQTYFSPSYVPQCPNAPMAEPISAEELEAIKTGEA